MTILADDRPRPPALPEDRFGETIAPRLLITFAALMFAAVVVLLGQRATVAGNELQIDRAIFTVVNAATLSGFQIAVNVTDFKLIGQIAIFALVVSGTLVTWIVSGWAIVRILGMPYSDWRIVQTSIGLYAIAVSIAANCLVRPGMDAFDAFFQASAALGNCGVFIGPAPRVGDWTVHAILFPLAILGGLGVPVILDFLGALIHRRRFHPHTATVLTLTAVVYLLGVAAIGSLQFAAAPHAGIEPAAIAGSSEAINERSASLPMGNFDQLTHASKWIAVALMTIGASPGGAGGGIKVTTLYLAIAGINRIIRGRPVEPMHGWAFLWIGLYALLALLGVICMLTLLPVLMGEQALFNTLSALATAGTTDQALLLPAAGLYCLSAVMLVGRLLPILLLWHLARRITGATTTIG